MKYALIVALMLALLGCSTPKKLRKNCEKVGYVIYECEDL